MTNIVYDVNNLTINAYYDKTTCTIKWSIQSEDGETSIFNAEQILTIISQLEKSLAYDWYKI